MSYSLRRPMGSSTYTKFLVCHLSRHSIDEARHIPRIEHKKVRQLGIAIRATEVVDHRVVKT